MFTRLSTLAVAVFLAHCPAAIAEGMLTGSSTYDPTTKLYNYSYSLQQFGPYDGKIIWLFSPTGGLDPLNPLLAPGTHTEPSGWRFSCTVGEPVVGTPQDALEWTWSAPVEGGVSPASEQAGFSFTTSLPPGTVHYQLDQDMPGVHAGYSGAPDGSGVVVGPSVATTPEPSTLVLLGVGGVGLAGYSWPRKKAPKA